MNRRKSSFKNTVITLLSEILVTGVGFLLPRAIVLNYGSESNGLITSLQQFFQYFTLLEGGLSGAAVFALYKPISTQNVEEVNTILYSAKKMYNKIGAIFSLIVLIASFVYPYFIADTEYSKLTITCLFCFIGLNGATQFLFIGKYKVLLNASQNSRYVALINSSSTILYSAIIILMSHLHIPLVIVIGGASFAYLFRAIAYYLVTKKKMQKYSYKSDHTFKFANQKEVFIQQILSLLIMNSSMCILLFSKTDMKQISVFSLYNMVLTAVFMITNAVNTGVSASFGDLIALNDKERLKQVYNEYELIFQMFWTVIFSCVSILYLPFMNLYAGEFTDTNYVRPILCIFFSVLGAVWVIRNQQSVIIVAAGKFKEIQKGSIIEAILTFGLSLAGLWLFGLEGLIAGWAISAMYRTIDFIIFNHRYILESSCAFTFKQISISILIILFINMLSFKLLQIVVIDTYVKWILLAICTAIVATALATIVLLITNKKMGGLKFQLHSLGKK